MKHLVIGHGEVGTALAELLGCDWSDLDTDMSDGQGYDTLHIAFPYGPDFVSYVSSYRFLLEPAHVVVHSTVPLGTCELLGAIHSPVRGVHPHMLAGLRTFVKFFGGPEANVVAMTWPGPTWLLKDARTCEALKLWDTTQYGLQLRLMQEMHRWCTENEVSFDTVYGLGNVTYNAGYQALGRPEVVRPHLLYAGPGIGGHCVLPNLELLDGTPVCDVVREGFK